MNGWLVLSLVAAIWGFWYLAFRPSRPGKKYPRGLPATAALPTKRERTRFNRAQENARRARQIERGILQATRQGVNRGRSQRGK